MKNKSRKAVLSVALGALLAVTAVAGPANAAGGYASTTIGSKTSVGLSNTWNSSSPLLPPNSALYIVASFSNHTTNSVKLSSFQVCYSGPSGSAIQYNPYTRNSSGNYWYNPSGYVSMATGTCRTFDPNMTYYKQSDGEVVRVVSQVDGAIQMTVAYFR